MKTPKYLFVAPMLFKILRLLFVLGGSVSIALIFIFESLGYTDVNIVDWSLSIGYCVSLIAIVANEIVLTRFNTKELGVHLFVYLTAKYYLDWSNEYMYFLGSRFDKGYRIAVQNRTKASR